jgi:hypothetical protein
VAAVRDEEVARLERLRRMLVETEEMIETEGDAGPLSLGRERPEVEERA